MDNRRRPPNHIGVICGLGTNGDNRPSTIHALRWSDDGLSTIHSTYYHHCLVTSLHEEKGGTVKFRCEREILADALATAGRAATSRTGTLPVLSGVRLDVVGDQLTVTGTDLELTIRLSVPVGGDRDGSVVVPARLVADIVKALPSGAVEVALGDDEMSISAGRSQFSVRPLSLGDYPAQVEPTPNRSRSTARRSPTRCARWCGPRAVTTPAPCSPACCCRRRTTASRWSPPTRTGSPCATCRSRRCWRPARRCSVPSRALNELQRILGGVAARSWSGSEPVRRCSRWAPRS